MSIPSISLDHKTISYKKLLWIGMISILAFGNVFLAVKYFAVQGELQAAQEEISQREVNADIVSFTKLFISRVLKAEAEIDFETRLQLETAVRNLGDEEILTQWQKFIGAKTEAEAQGEVKNLLDTLVSKIKVQ